jgi:hypothetical protein
LRARSPPSEATEFCSSVAVMADGGIGFVGCVEMGAAQQVHGVAHQTCLSHLAREVAFVDETSEDMLPSRLRLSAVIIDAESEIDRCRKLIAGIDAKLEAMTNGGDASPDVSEKFRCGIYDITEAQVPPGRGGWDAGGRIVLRCGTSPTAIRRDALEVRRALSPD